MGRVIGLDVGTKTIGVAVSDPSRMLASPVVTVSRKGLKTDIPKLLDLIQERAVEIALPVEVLAAADRAGVDTLTLPGRLGHRPLCLAARAVEGDPRLDHGREGVAALAALGPNSHTRAGAQTGTPTVRVR